MYVRYVQIEVLIFLENELILKVVVYVGEATARRIGNGSFDQKKKCREQGITGRTSLSNGTEKRNNQRKNKRTKQNKTKTNSNRARDSNLTRD